MTNPKAQNRPDKAPEIVTFGCRLNLHESDTIRQNAENAGLDDAIIFNTCAVTKEAERQARQAIRRARRDNPNARIIVTGCSAQINPQTYNEMDEVDQIIGNELKMQPDIWQSLQKAGDNIHQDNKVLVNDIMSIRETAAHLIDPNASPAEGRARAFLQVQQGCDHRCTFCIIPYGRGNSRSVPIGVIVDQAKLLVAQGYQEIVLTGVDITSYGADLPGQPSLGQMMRRLLALVPDLPRLRLSSIDLVEIDEDLWRLIAEEPRLMPHLHLSMQAGDDMILKRMKRRHLREDIYKMCERARELRPDIVFGADIIAGFPTETDAMFENTRQVVAECNLTYLHVFPYSEREGTPAARMPQVDPKLRKERAAILRKEGQKNLTDFLTTQIGKTRQVIIEQAIIEHVTTKNEGPKNIIARTEHFAEVEIASTHSPAAGTLHHINITGADNSRLIGQLV